MLSSGHGFNEVLDLADQQTCEYGATLHEAAPMINTPLAEQPSLLMLGISYFMDHEKELHWLGRFEKFLSKFGRFENFKVFVMLLVAMLLYATADPSHREAILITHQSLGQLFTLG